MSDLEVAKLIYAAARDAVWALPDGWKRNVTLGLVKAVNPTDGTYPAAVVCCWNTDMPVAMARDDDRSLIVIMGMLPTGTVRRIRGLTLVQRALIDAAAIRIGHNRGYALFWKMAAGCVRERAFTLST